MVLSSISLLVTQLNNENNRLCIYKSMIRKMIELN